MMLQKATLSGWNHRFQCIIRRLARNDNEHDVLEECFSDTTSRHIYLT
jgi:hypothetical protein